MAGSWQRDPLRRFEWRYFDEEGWTDEVVDRKGRQLRDPFQPADKPGWPPEHVVIGLAAATAAVSTLFPWVSAFGIGVAAIQSPDAWLLLAVSALGILGVVSLRRAPRVLAVLELVLGGAAIFIGVVDLLDVRDRVDASGGFAQVGTGLYLALASGAVWVLAALVSFRVRRVLHRW